MVIGLYMYIFFKLVIFFFLHYSQNGCLPKFLFLLFFVFNKRQPHTKQKKVNTAGRVGPKETDYSA